MRRASMVAAALLIAAAPAAVLFLASASAAGQMTLYSLASGDSFIELGREGGIGDTTVWNSELQDEQRKKIGTTAGSCVRVEAVIDGGWIVVASWPIDTERQGRLRAMDSAVLAGCGNSARSRPISAFGV